VSNKALFGQFKIYPRGFLGAYLPPILVGKPAYARRTSSLLYDTSIFDANDSKAVVANTELEELYDKYVRKDILIGDFKFREDVLRCMLKAFGTQDFEGWYMAQFQSPSFGYNHRKFLNETIAFFNAGKPRQLSLQSWEAIIQAKDEPKSDIELEEYTKALFGKDDHRHLSPSGKVMLVDVIQSWMRRPNGIGDLLHTGHILFGL
jgi:hypothetical protein